MNEPENFLERWSRKKAEAARDGDAAPPRGGYDAASTISATEPQQPVPPPEFDLTKLPSLESITSATDIRAFLSPGVPHELTRAALRRVWTADPAIRDFVGLAENAWDFTDPNSMPGFGGLPLGYDVKKLVAEVFGELKQVGATEREAPQVASSEFHSTGESGGSSGLAGLGDSGSPTDPPPQIASVQPAPDMREVFVQRESIAAAQYSRPADEDLPPPRHGGVLPK